MAKMTIGCCLKLEHHGFGVGQQRHHLDSSNPNDSIIHDALERDDDDFGFKRESSMVRDDRQRK